MQRQIVKVLGERPDRVPHPLEGEQGFLPIGSPAHVFNVDPGNIVGGILAMLMQALHPAVAAGFIDHSNYRNDPFGRMLRTTTFIREVTFGSQTTAANRIAQVRNMHSSVRGMNASGVEYDAEDPRLLEWVFLCFVYGFVAGYKAFGAQRVGKRVLDSYVTDMARIGRAFDLPTVPETVIGLVAQIDALAVHIAPSAQSRQLIGYLWSPQALGRFGRSESRLVIRSAGSLLPGSLHTQARAVGIPTGGHLAARTVTKSMIRLVRWSFDTDPNLDEVDLRPFVLR